MFQVFRQRRAEPSDPLRTFSSQLRKARVKGGGTFSFHLLLFHNLAVLVPDVSRCTADIAFLAWNALPNASLGFALCSNPDTTVCMYTQEPWLCLVVICRAVSLSLSCAVQAKCWCCFVCANNNTLNITLSLFFYRTAKRATSRSHVAVFRWRFGY
jgi:hypothetical protein